MAVQAGRAVLGDRAAPTCTTWCSSRATSRCSRAATVPRCVAGLGLPATDARWWSRSVAVPRCSTRCSRRDRRHAGDRRRHRPGKRRGRGGGRPTATASRSRRSRACSAACRCGARGSDGVVHDYDDPRLVRERGMRAALTDAGIARKAVAAVGLPAEGRRRALRGRRAARADDRRERAAVRTGRTGRDARERPAARVRAGDDDRGRTSPPAARYGRRAVERAPQDAAAARRVTPGPEIRISLPAYERAFDAKVRLEAGPLSALRHAGAAAAPPLSGLRRRGRCRARRAAARRDRLHDDHHPHPGPRAGDALHDRDRRAGRHRGATPRPGHRRAAGQRRHRRPRRRWCCAGSPSDPGSPTTATRSRPPNDPTTPRSRR